MTVLSITCPRCGCQVTSRGASHCGPGGQWECRCGHIEQDRGQGTYERPPTQAEILEALDFGRTVDQHLRY